METLAVGHEPAVQMIDTSVVRVHRHGACISHNNQQDMGRSRRGLTCKIHAVVDTNACRCISPSLRTRRMTTCCVRFSSAACFPKRCCLRIADRRRLDQGAYPPARRMGEHSAETKSQRSDLLQPYLYRAWLRASESTSLAYRRHCQSEPEQEWHFVICADEMQSTLGPGRRRGRCRLRLLRRWRIGLHLAA
jgi:hypothetical protein